MLKKEKSLSWSMKATGGEFHCPYRHDALQQARVRFRWDLPLHWPFLHYRCNLGIIHIEDAEAGHVDATETIRLQVYGHQVLLGHNSNQRVCHHWGVLDGSSSPLRRTMQELIKEMLNWRGNGRNHPIDFKSGNIKSEIVYITVKSCPDERRCVYFLIIWRCFNCL